MSSEVVFCFDGDRAGRQAAWRALENSLGLARDGRELRFMFLPEGHDPDTLVAAEGATAFEDRLKAALTLSDYLIGQLQSEVDLTHEGGRAKLAALAKPLFARMPEGVYRALMIDRLAAEIRMPAAKLQALMTAGGPPKEFAARSEPTRVRRGHMSVGRGNLLTQAITLVLHHPAAARAVQDPARLKGLNKPGVNVLLELLEQSTSAQEPNTATLLERWRDRVEFERLATLATAQPLVADPSVAGQELQMAVEKLLEEYGPGRRMDELLRKSEEMGLNSQEKAELGALLKAKDRPRVSPAKDGRR
jgi:DNA primase